MSKNIMKGVAAGALLLLCAGPALAGFDAIVPQEVRIDTGNSYSGYSSSTWGWIVATDQTITQTDLQNAVVSATTSDPLVLFSNSLQNAHYGTPLAPGEVAGKYSAAENAAAFTPYLSEGESLKAPDWPLWNFGISYSVGYTADVPLNGLLTMDGEYVSYSTLLRFGPWEQAGVSYMASGQRLTSQDMEDVPEPISLVFFGTGLAAVCGFALRGKRRSV